MKELHDLETYEVSFVPKGANGKKFLVFKNLKGKTGMQSAQELLDLVKKGADKETLARVEKVLKEHMDAHAAASDAGGEAAPALSEKGKAALQAVVRILTPMKEELSPELIKQVLAAAGFELEHEGAEKAFGHMMDDSDDGDEEDGDEEEMEKHFEGIPAEVLSDMKDVLKSKAEKADEEDEEVSKKVKGHIGEAMKAAGKMYKAHLQKLGYQKYPEAKMQFKSVAKDFKQVDIEDEAHAKGEAKSMDKIGKSFDLSKVDPKVKTALEAVFKSNKEAVEKAAKLEGELKVEREARRTKEFIEKAASLKVGASTEDVASILKSVDAVDPELAKKLEAVLKGAGEQISKSALFGEIGSQNGIATPGSDALSKLDAMTDGLVQKSTGLSRADAYEQVLKSAEGQKLYQEFKGSRKDGI